MGWLCRRTNCSRHTWGQGRGEGVQASEGEWGGEGVFPGLAPTLELMAQLRLPGAPCCEAGAWGQGGLAGRGVGSTWFMTSTSAACVQKQSCTETKVRPLLRSSKGLPWGGLPSQPPAGSAASHAHLGPPPLVGPAPCRSAQVLAPASHTLLAPPNRPRPSH